MIHPVRVAFRTRPAAPRPGVAVDLVYHDPDGEIPEFWTLRMYRDNLKALDYSTENSIVVHNWVSDIMRSLRAVEAAQRGVDAEYGRVWLEIFDTMPKGVR